MSPADYPAETATQLSDEPRIGVFICSCGSNIAGVVDVAAVTQYAESLPNVAHAENTMYTCSADSLKLMQDRIREKKLNRVIVSSCTPRTHEPIFRETIRDLVPSYTALAVHAAPLSDWREIQRLLDHYFNDLPASRHDSASSLRPNSK